MSNTILISVYCTTLPAIVLFGLTAIYLGYKENRVRSETNQTLDHFLAAHKTQPLNRVIYSFMSTSLGAWVIFTPASFSLIAGYLGLMSYSIASGITLLIPGYFGPLIRSYSNSLSLNDFINHRFGKIAQYYVTILCLYNMVIGMIAEYTAIGDLFEKIIGGNRVMIVILIGLITSIYTAYGGLSVSIKTDQLQGIFVILMNIIFAIYMISTFRLDSSRPLSENLGANEYGYNSIVAMPLALAGSVVFSESFWQKAWAANTDKDLKIGSYVASILIIVIVFLFGFYGFIAAWAGFTINDSNLALFAIFENNKDSWILVIICNMAVIMNESAVDSYQMGIVSSISSCFFKKKPLWVTQILVVLINIPIIYLSLKNYGIINLFLSSNLITCAASIPLLLGLNKKIASYYGTFNMIFSTVLSVFFAGLWGVLDTGDFTTGIKQVFYDCYCWKSFLIASLGSLFFALLITFIRYKFGFHHEGCLEEKFIKNPSAKGEKYLKIKNI